MILVVCTCYGTVLTMLLSPPNPAPFPRLRPVKCLILAGSSAAPTIAGTTTTSVRSTDARYGLSAGLYGTPRCASYYNFRLFNLSGCEVLVMVRQF